MKKMLVTVLCVSVAILVCKIVVFPYLSSGRPSPTAHGLLREELILEVQEIQRSKLNRSRLFPALNSTDINKLDLEGISEKDCSETQKNPSQEYERIPQHFRPTTTQAERFLMLLTLQMFIKTMEEHGLTYILEGGTLLGAFRHHGLIPWDDDIDVMVRSSDERRVRQVLSNVPGYQAFCPDNFPWKFFKKGLKTLRHKQYIWPYVDIYFFSDLSDYVVSSLTAKTYGHRHWDVFPLCYHPFEGAMLPVPRSISVVLEADFSIQDCKPMTYCHKVETKMQTLASVPCDDLSRLSRLPSLYRFQGKAKA